MKSIATPNPYEKCQGAAKWVKAFFGYMVGGGRFVPPERRGVGNVVPGGMTLRFAFGTFPLRGIEPKDFSFQTPRGA
jgi:hypothetical protein